MRLSNRLQRLFKNAVTATFGDVDVYLFGSRTDATKKGGDIDIAITTELPRHEFQNKKIALITTLVRRGFDLKIDIVQYSHRTDALLRKEIQQNGLLL